MRKLQSTETIEMEKRDVKKRKPEGLYDLKKKKTFFILNDQWLQVIQVVVITQPWTSSSQFSSSLRRAEIYYFHVSQISPKFIYFSAFSKTDWNHTGMCAMKVHIHASYYLDYVDFLPFLCKKDLLALSHLQALAIIFINLWKPSNNF